MTTVIADPFLFDPAVFKQQLVQTSAPLPLFKQALSDGYQYLTAQFKTGQDIERLVKQQSWLVDELLVLAWQQFIDSDDLCLIAVGGYGRAELLLASDIDLMVLEPPHTTATTKQQLATFLTFLWDFGLEVGHSVRTVKECYYQAKNDITIMTNIMESRRLYGNEKLYEDMRKKTAPNKIWPVPKYFTAKHQEQKKRHQKYNDSEHKLEPNVKESPGGLRDLQTISWVAKRHFDSIDLSRLVRHQFLTKEEYESLKAGRNLLWRIRFALHMTTKRREDRLLFGFQRNIAELFGYHSQDNQAVEKFMKLYFKTVSENNRLNEILLQHFEEGIIYRNRKEKIVEINNRFQTRNNFIEVKNLNIFKRYPFALLEIFLLIQQNPKIKGIRANTIRLLRDHLYLIDESYRQDIGNQSLFMEIIKQPNLVGHKLRMMHRYGILGAYLPAFAAVEGLMQFDLFHIFTVDEHILTVIQQMRLFGTTEYQTKFPNCDDIIKKLPKLELLYLAGLFHDIAKGRGGDHSKLGAGDALEFCRLHQLSNYDSTLVAWLVANHLLLSKTAQKEDIDAPEVITKFTAIIGDQIHLNYLFILTVADTYGTNPDLWNNWKATLLNNLYHRTLQELRRSKENPILINQRIKDTKDKALVLLKQSFSAGADLQPSVQHNIITLWQTIGNDYFLRHNPDEIAWHTKGLLADHHKPLLLIKNFPSRGGSLIFVYMDNRKNVFSIVTSAIERLGLNVVDARIITTDQDYILYTFIVLTDDGNMIKIKERRHEIKSRILTSIDAGTMPKQQQRYGKQLKTFNIPTRVTFTNDEKNKRTIMEVTTIDYPGVLSRIGLAMDHCGIHLQGAKIATYGERVEDIFFLQNNEQRAIDDPIKLECLHDTIVTAFA